MNLVPIGVVRSPIRDRKDLPPLGVGASVELYPEFAAGVLHIEKHSHLWVLAWLDTARRAALQVVPRGLKDQGDAGLHGVFAVRSPSRPNPIGLTAARVVGTGFAQGQLRIDFDALDFNDGTPIIDLKPYFPSRDMIFSATTRQVGRAATIDAVRESARMQALAFSGEASVGLDLAVEIITHFRTEVLGFTDPGHWDITVPIERPKLMQALTGLTRTWPNMHSVDAVVFRHGGAAYEYELHEDSFRFYPH
jgi:tRNA (adenine37-N6)-methyltransferase